MRLYTTQHPFYCSIDLHARTMYVCIIDQNGEILVPRNMKTIDLQEMNWKSRTGLHE